MIPSILLEKAAVRRELRAVRIAEEAKRSEVVCDTLLASLLKLEGIRSIALYAAIRGEPSLGRLFLALGQKYIVCYPRIVGEEMEFRCVADAGDLQAGKWGIAEPSDAAPLMQEVDLIICPGVAFTREGARLGQGKGYYDRYIAGMATRPLLWGVQFAERIKTTLPHEMHDVLMDQVFIA